MEPSSLLSAIITLSLFESCQNSLLSIPNDGINVKVCMSSGESVLSKSGYSEVAKAYILYRKIHEKQRAIKDDEEIEKEGVEEDG